MFTFAGLIIVLILVLIMPFVNKLIERNLEIFLFIMGIAASVVAGVLTKELLLEILSNKFIYMITIAVLVSGLIFKRFKSIINKAVRSIINYLPLSLFVFFMIVLLGMASSFVTAIIASLLLVEIVNALPVNWKMKVNIVILSCFSIGLGAALTPVGEPLATVVVSRLDENFSFLLVKLGEYIIPGIIVLGIIGAFIAGKKSAQETGLNEEKHDIFEDSAIEIANEISTEEETYKGIIERTIKVFVFVMALELLGSGFKPLIDRYVVDFNSNGLYWMNMLSAVLDNATLASAEISSRMDGRQITAILMGLLISGGMLIPGNIPNIISAGKLKIGSKEWARVGIPIGLVLMIAFYIIIFYIL